MRSKGKQQSLVKQLPFGFSVQSELSVTRDVLSS